MLTLRLKIQLQHRLQMAKLSPDQLQGMSLKQIAELRLPYGMSELALGDAFEITGSPSDHLQLKDCCALMDGIGQDMRSGKIEIHGDVGHYLGLNMRGEIELFGNASNFVACQMQDGLLRVHGNVGDFAGGALIGNRRGMRGGTLIVNGNAGARLGDQMRRGTILVDGNVGDYFASNMIAGTIAIAGQYGLHGAYAMRHGTVILLQPPQTMSATWVDVGQHQLPFLKLLFKAWQGLPSRFAEMTSIRAQRWMGDLASDGKGEILFLHP